MENSLYPKVSYDRMFIYAWYEKTNEYETKFGEHWVKAGVDPKTDIDKYIRSSMNRRKDLFDDGTIVVESIWDVTEYSKKYDKYYPKSHVDDKIRKEIGYVKQSEVHNLHFAILVEKVNEILNKENQQKPEVGLSTAQYDDAVLVLNAIDNGKRVIFSELAARYGKTIWSSAIAVETGIPIVIVILWIFNNFKTLRL